MTTVAPRATRRFNRRRPCQRRRQSVTAALRPCALDGGEPRSRAVVASSPVASVSVLDTDHAGLIDTKVELPPATPAASTECFAADHHSHAAARPHWGSPVLCEHEHGGPRRAGPVGRLVAAECCSCAGRASYSVGRRRGRGASSSNSACRNPSAWRSGRLARAEHAGSGAVPSMARSE